MEHVAEAGNRESQIRAGKCVTFCKLGKNGSFTRAGTRGKHSNHVTFFLQKWKSVEPVVKQGWETWNMLLL